MYGLSEKEISQIKKFTSISNHLMKSGFYVAYLRKGVIGVKNINVGKKKKVELETFGFDEDSMRSALLDFRKIYNQSEDANFYKICNLIERSEVSTKARKKARELRAQFSKTLNEPITHYDRSTKDAPKHVIDKWINGFYFHLNDEKESKLSEMTMIKPVHKLIFVVTVLELSKTAIALSGEIGGYFETNATQ